MTETEKVLNMNSCTLFFVLCVCLINTSPIALSQPNQVAFSYISFIWGPRFYLTVKCVRDRNPEPRFTIHGLWPARANGSSIVDCVRPNWNHYTIDGDMNGTTMENAPDCRCMGILILAWTLQDTVEICYGREPQLRYRRGQQDNARYLTGVNLCVGPGPFSISLTVHATYQVAASGMILSTQSPNFMVDCIDRAISI